MVLFYMVACKQIQICFRKRKMMRPSVFDDNSTSKHRKRSNEYYIETTVYDIEWAFLIYGINHLPPLKETVFDPLISNDIQTMT